MKFWILQRIDHVWRNRPTVRRLADNAFWLLIDQVVRMGAGLWIGIWIARYLGPEQYGWLSYALATVGMVGAFFSLGIGGIVVRELVKSPDEANAWIGTAAFLRVVGSGVGFLVCVGVALLLPVPETQVRWLIMVVSAGLLVQSWEVVDLFFQARSEAKVSAWVRMAACLLGSVVKIGLLLTEASLLAFAVAGVLETAFAAMGWVGMAWLKGSGPKRWVVEWARAKSLLQEGWPIALSGLAIYTQAYVDQLVIGAILGGEQLGQYAAAIRLVTVFAFIPTVVMTVAAPEITRAKRDDGKLYLRRLHDLYRLMFLLFVAVALPLGIFGPIMVELLYGAPYAGAAALLPWLSLRLLLTNLGVARGIFVTNEGTFRFALLTGIVGAFTNLGLNLLFVPTWGSLGAVVASLVSFSVTIFALEAFHPRMRLNLFIMVKAVLLPWRRFSA